MTARVAVATALQALAESAAVAGGEQRWLTALDRLAEALASRETLHAKQALLNSWRERLRFDDGAPQDTGASQAPFWAPVLARWEAYSYRVTVSLFELLLWQSRLEDSRSVAWFHEGLQLWPIPDPDATALALAWRNDQTFVTWLRTGAFRQVLEAKHALLLRETELLDKWITVSRTLDVEGVAAVVWAVATDFGYLLPDRNVPLAAKLAAVDSTRAMLAATDTITNKEVDDAVDMFWDLMLPRPDPAPRAVMDRLREVLVWHASFGSVRSRRAVEHALDHWPLREEVPSLLKRFGRLGLKDPIVWRRAGSDPGDGGG